MVQESILVGYVPSAWKSYVFQFQRPPADVAPQDGVYYMNKFEQVPCHHNQMSLAGGSPGLMSIGEGAPYLTCPGGGGVHYHVAYPMKYLMLLMPCEQTDACGNITFPQLCLRAVKIWSGQNPAPSTNNTLPVLSF